MGLRDRLGLGDDGPPEEWFRRTTWSAEIAEEFEQRLARVRSEGDRVECLRIQGGVLAESGTAEHRTAGRELLERAVAGAEHYPAAAAFAQLVLSELAQADGDLAGEAAYLRAAIDPTNQAEASLLQLLIDHPELAADGDEIDALLDNASTDSGYGIFMSQQFSHCLARARGRARRGEADAAALYATAALWVHQHDQPTAWRHAGVGLVGDPGDEVLSELRSLAAGGDPEAAWEIPDAFRALDGEVSWRWELIARFERGDRVDDEFNWFTQQARQDGVVTALREAGFEPPPFGLTNWSVKQLPSAAEARRAAVILVDALERSDDPDLHEAIGYALRDPRVRKVAADPVLEAFARRWTDELNSADPDAKVSDELGGQNRARNGLGSALASLARDEQFERMVELIDDPTFDGDAYLYWALPYVKDPRAVDCAVRWLGEAERAQQASQAEWVGRKTNVLMDGGELPPHEHLAPLRLLADLRSERGEATLRRYAEQVRPTGRWDVDSYKRLEIDIAQGGLDKLAKARAKGRARP